MNAENYYDSALRTAIDLGQVNNKLHGLLGLISEAGEIADLFKRAVAYGKPIDPVHLLEECGDVMWYVPLLYQSMEADPKGFVFAVETSREELPLLMTELEMGTLLGQSISVVGLQAQIVQLSEHRASLNETAGILSLLLRALLSAYGFTLEEAMEKNIAKLRARYPEKFDQSLALGRDLQRERDALEGISEPR